MGQRWNEMLVRRTQRDAQHGGFGYEDHVAEL
jgi:hypothetical protein